MDYCKILTFSSMFTAICCCCLWTLPTTEAFDGHVDERSYFTAAVYEHKPWYSPETPDGKAISDDCETVVEVNLQYYAEAARVAKSKGADVIVYPKHGIFERGSTENFEMIPDPFAEKVNPCADGAIFSDRPILRKLSCIASNNTMVVVANTGDIQNCSGVAGSCTPGGLIYYSTNVVFDRDGTLILKYHEGGRDFRFKKRNNTFQTDFGTFAISFTYDLFFTRAEKVDAVFFPTRWVNIFPQAVFVSIGQAWALRNNMTLIAANVHLPGESVVGSGIFHSRNGALAYTFDPDRTSKLIVANVPKAGFPPVPPNASIIDIKTNRNVLKDGVSVPYQCSKKLLGISSGGNGEYRCLEAIQSVHKLVRIVEPSGKAEACYEGSCCSLSYKTTDDGFFGNETFYLAVSKNPVFHYCYMMRCDAFEGTECVIFPQRSRTVFLDVYLRTNISESESLKVYPQVVSSGVRLVPPTEWHLFSGEASHHPHHLHPHFENVHHHSGYAKDERSLHFESKAGRRLIFLSLGH